MKARSAACCVLALGGVIAMLVSFFAFASLVALYCSAAASLVGGAVSGVRAFAGTLMGVGFVGGWCILVVAAGAEGGITVPDSAVVFGILSPVFVVVGLVVLAFSLRRDDNHRGWPWLS